MSEPITTNHAELVTLYQKLHTNAVQSVFTSKEWSILRIALLKQGASFEMDYDRDETYFCHLHKPESRIKG